MPFSRSFFRILRLQLRQDPLCDAFRQHLLTVLAAQEGKLSRIGDEARLHQHGVHAAGIDHIERGVHRALDPALMAPSALSKFRMDLLRHIEHHLAVGTDIRLIARRRRILCGVQMDRDQHVRAGLLREEELPENDVMVLGHSSRDRINRMITSIYENSAGKNDVKMGDAEAEALEHLRSFMFEKVYITPLSMKEEERAKRMLGAVYEYFYNNIEKLPPFYRSLTEKWPVEQVLCDYLSSMTDKFAVAVFNNLFVPRSWALTEKDIEELD